jgi:hypothetical protein
LRKLKNYFRIALGVWLLAVSIPVEGQQTNKIPRAGCLSGTAASPNDPFLEGLRDL